jgi:hypothetical protein
VNIPLSLDEYYWKFMTKASTFATIFNHDILFPRGDTIEALLKGIVPEDEMDQAISFFFERIVVDYAQKGNVIRMSGSGRLHRSRRAVGCR